MEKELLKKFSERGVVFSNRLRFSSVSLFNRVKDAWKDVDDDIYHWLNTYIASQNTAFEDGLLTLSEVENRHYAVFAKEDLDPYRYIAEYSGVVKKRSFSMIFTNPYCVEYHVGFSTLKTYVIDALYEGNITRFFNHSKNSNLIMQFTLLGGIPHFLIFTKRPIRKGEQLTLNYGKKFWFQMMRIPKATLE